MGMIDDDEDYKDEEERALWTLTIPAINGCHGLANTCFSIHKVFLGIICTDLYDDDEDKNDCGNDNNDCGDDDDNDRISGISWLSCQRTFEESYRIKVTLETATMTVEKIFCDPQNIMFVGF